MQGSSERRLSGGGRKGAALPSGGGGGGGARRAKALRCRGRRFFGLPRVMVGRQVIVWSTDELIQVQLNWGSHSFPVWGREVHGSSQN